MIGGNGRTAWCVSEANCKEFEDKSAQDNARSSPFVQRSAQLHSAGASGNEVLKLNSAGLVQGCSSLFCGSMSEKKRPRRLGATIAMAVATPAALAIETTARVLFLPPDLNILRQELEPALTPVAWGLLVVAAASVPLGFAAKRSVTKRLVAKVNAYGGGEEKLAEARFEAIFVAASIPQIPALLATVALTAGASALPVLLAVGLSVFAVLTIAHEKHSAP